MRREPSFFCTNNTGAPYGEALGSINPLSSSSLICLLTSACSTGDVQNGRLKVGLAPSSSLMV
eukprot:331334-Pelagomonas_calceolata.AAC.1